MADVDRVKTMASRDGWHSFRVQKLDLDALPDFGAAVRGKQNPIFLPKIFDRYIVRTTDGKLKVDRIQTLGGAEKKAKDLLKKYPCVGVEIVSEKTGTVVKSYKASVGSGGAKVDRDNTREYAKEAKTDEKFVLYVDGREFATYDTKKEAEQAGKAEGGRWRVKKVVGNPARQLDLFTVMLGKHGFHVVESDTHGGTLYEMSGPHSAQILVKNHLPGKLHPWYYTNGSYKRSGDGVSELERFIDGRFPKPRAGRQVSNSSSGRASNPRITGTKIVDMGGGYGLMTERSRFSGDLLYYPVERGISHPDGKPFWHKVHTSAYGTPEYDFRKRATVLKFIKQLQSKGAGETGRRGNPSNRNLSSWDAKQLLESLTGQGAPWPDFYTLSSSAVRDLVDAPELKFYRAPKGASGSRGRYLYEYLIKRAGERQRLGPDGTLRRNNPETSADLYSDFHGKPSTQEIVYESEEFERTSFAELGTLIEIKVKCRNGSVVSINAAAPDSGNLEEIVKLASSPDGRQLYFIGGDQSVDVKKFGLGVKDIRDNMLLGTIEEITYETEKGFHKFQKTQYFHKLGEETGVKPVLAYNPQNETLSVVGGQYVVKDVGICN
jgi:hypothetical protein